MLAIAPHIAHALATNQPVVALESTIITHGMPYPSNIETALDVEDVVRAYGAIPATIAVIAGKICVGLSKDEIERIGTPDPRRPVIKLSRRDLPYAIATQKNGATTVAATMICAQKAGIQIFATGGIGGVHRQGESTLDISADLQELSQTNVGVVCSGAKAILDIGRTLEVLETLGVPVVGFQTDEFPAFYYRDSGYKVDFQLDTPEEIARLLNIKWQLGLNGGVLIANPVPEMDALLQADIEELITQALQEADRLKIKGKEITPYLLSKIAQNSGGLSLKCNIALIKDNARVAAKIAKALSA